MPPPKYPPYTATINSKIEAPATARPLDSCDIPAAIRPVRCLQNANSSVAPSSNHGNTRKKVCAGVLISSAAPASPPTTLVTINGTITRRVMFSRFRYAPPLAVVPIHNASVFVAFAATGATPVNNSAGNATKLPPPATALIAPPSAPAPNKNMACPMSKRAFVSRIPDGAPPHAAPNRVLTMLPAAYMNVPPRYWFASGIFLREPPH
jgi:hypothetical protein